MQKRETNTLYNTVCIFLGIGMIFSFNLWGTFRAYPLLPLIPEISLEAVNTTFLVLFIVLVSISNFKSALRQYYVFGAVISLLILLIIDLNRLQPWLYAYAFMIISFGLYSADKNKFYQCVLLIMGLSYIWSGFQKVNYNYINQTFPQLIEPFVGNHPMYTIAAAASFMIEIIGGVALLSTRFRRVGIAIMMVTHLFILSLTGPWGLSTNSVIWPWNLCYILILVQLWNFEENLSLNALLNAKNKYQLVLVILLGLLPVLSLFNLWPKYMSSALYSGNKIKTELFISDDFKAKLPESVQAAVNDTTNTISLLTWSFAEMNVPSQPELLLYEQAFDRLCERTSNEFDLILKLYSEPNIYSGKREETSYFCDESFYEGQ